MASYTKNMLFATNIAPSAMNSGFIGSSSNYWDTIYIDKQIVGESSYGATLPATGLEGQIFYKTSNDINNWIIDEETGYSITSTSNSATPAFNIKEGGKGWALGGYAQSEHELAVYAPQIKVKRNENQYAEVIAENTVASVGLLAAQGGRHGLYSETDQKWMLYHEPAGTVLDSPLFLRSVGTSNADTYIEARNTFGRVELDVNSGMAGIWGGPSGKEKWLIYTNNGGETTIPLPLIVQNHASEIGDYIAGSLAISAPSGVWSDGFNSVELSAGSWIVQGSIYFPSNSTGKREIELMNTGHSAYGQRTIENTVVGDYTILSVTCPVRLSSTTTMQVRGWQNSGSAMTITGYIYAIRVA